MVARVRLVHWKVEEAGERVRALQRLGYEVEAGRPEGPAFLRALREDPPRAVVIDLGRLPSAGRDVGVTIRMTKALRSVPLVFVGGEPQKVGNVRAVLPDAVYTQWERIGPALARAIAKPVQRPVKPESVFAQYAGRPLAQKLGIKSGARVALVAAPAGFRAMLGELPEDARFVKVGRDREGGHSLAVWFVRSGAQLREGIERMAGIAASAPLWIVWAKKGSARESDVTQQLVRKTGLAAGLVDYKICRVDEDWAGLLFRRR